MDYPKRVAHFEIRISPEETEKVELWLMSMGHARIRCSDGVGNIERRKLLEIAIKIRGRAEGLSQQREPDDKRRGAAYYFLMAAHLWRLGGASLEEVADLGDALRLLFELHIEAKRTNSVKTHDISLASAVNYKMMEILDGIHTEIRTEADEAISKELKQLQMRKLDPEQVIFQGPPSTVIN